MPAKSSNRKEALSTERAPAAVGTYSQAVRTGNFVHVSGQIGLDPVSGDLAVGFQAQAQRVFDNLAGICEAAGGSLDDIVKLNVYLIDLAHFARVNELMTARFTEPYPARAALGVAALPKGAEIEVDALLQLPS